MEVQGKQRKAQTLTWRSLPLISTELPSIKCSARKRALGSPPNTSQVSLLPVASGHPRTEGSNETSVHERMLDAMSGANDVVQCQECESRLSCDQEFCPHCGLKNPSWVSQTLSWDEYVCRPWWNRCRRSIRKSRATAFDYSDLARSIALRGKHYFDGGDPDVKRAWIKLWSGDLEWTRYKRDAFLKSHKDVLTSHDRRLFRTAPVVRGERTSFTKRDWRRGEGKQKPRPANLADIERSIDLWNPFEWTYEWRNDARNQLLWQIGGYLREDSVDKLLVRGANRPNGWEVSRAMKRERDRSV